MCLFVAGWIFTALFSWTIYRQQVTCHTYIHFAFPLNTERQASKDTLPLSNLKRDPTQDWSSMSTSAVISGFSEFPFWRPGNRLTLVHTNQDLIRGAILIHYITGGSLNFSPDKASGPCGWWIVPRYLFLSRADDWSGEMRNHPFVICQLC